MIQEIATEEIIALASSSGDEDDEDEIDFRNRIKLLAEEIILVEEQITATEAPIEEEIIVVSPIEDVVLVEEPEEIIEEATTEEAASILEEIVLPEVEVIPIVETTTAPIIEAIPVQEDLVPIVEDDAPIVQSAPIFESGPIQEESNIPIEAAEGNFQVQVLPTEESNPIEAAIILEAAPVPEEPVFTPSGPPAPSQDPIIPIQEFIVGEAADPVVDEIAQEADNEGAQNTLPRRVRQRLPAFVPLPRQPGRVAGVFRNLRSRTSKLVKSVIGLLGN